MSLSNQAHFFIAGLFFANCLEKNSLQISRVRRIKKKNGL